MKNIVIIAFALLIFSFASCRKKLDIDIPETEKHIVLNGIINPDSIISVRVTKSKSVLDNNEIQNLSDADVKLFKDDEFVEELQFSDIGYFYSSIKPEINTNYKITADYSGLKSVSAEINLEESPLINKTDTLIQMKIYDYGDGLSDTTYEIHFDLQYKDNGGTDDYYFLSIFQLIPVFDFTDTGMVFTGYEEYSGYFDTTDPVLNKENSEFYLDGMNGRVFSDELFNGNSYTLSFTTFYQNYGGYYDKKNIKTEEYPGMFVIKLLKVSEAIYNYIFSYNLNQNSTEDPFAQPVQVYSNVKNGLGIFSGYTMTSDTIVMNNPEK